MKSIYIVILILVSVNTTFSQNDDFTIDKKAKNRYVIGFIPSAAQNIYGLAIGPVGSEAVCNRPYTKYSHGLNLQIPGQGFFQIFYINQMKFENAFNNENSDTLNSKDSLPKRAIHNGLIISPLGTFTTQINGISISLWMSKGETMNGLTFNLLWNVYEQVNGITIGFVNHTAVTNGVQIGLINKTKKSKGLQIGLWNTNENRSLPLINWNFTR
jgi:hypothetical protein